jgi:hypothetical protein
MGLISAPCGNLAELTNVLSLPAGAACRMRGFQRCVHCGVIQKARCGKGACKEKEAARDLAAGGTAAAQALTRAEGDVMAVLSGSFMLLWSRGVAERKAGEVIAKIRGRPGDHTGNQVRAVKKFAEMLLADLAARAAAPSPARS